MFAGLAMLCLGRRFLGRQNLIRGGVFTATLVTYLLWRHSYYGAWVPNTFTADESAGPSVPSATAATIRQLSSFWASSRA